MIHHETKQDRREAKPSRFTPDWNDPDMPLLRYRVSEHTAMIHLQTMQRVIDAILPYTVSQPVAVVVTRHPGDETYWTFTNHPAHDTLRSRVETVTETVANAVTGRKGIT